MSKVEQWAEVVGFENLGYGVIRGSINELHMESVRKALTEMGLSKIGGGKPAAEVWSDKGNENLVLLYV